MTKQANTTPATFVEGDRVEVTNDRTGNEPMAGEIVEIKKGWFRVVLDEEFEDANGKLVTEVSARESSLLLEEDAPDRSTEGDEEFREEDLPEEEGDEEGTHSKMAEALRRARVHYTKALRPDGTPTAHCGDLIAKVLLESDPLEVCSFADSICEEAPGHHAQRYASLNNGQKRMNSGNKIRAAWRKALELGDGTTLKLIAQVLGIDDEEVEEEQDPESSDADFEGNHGV